MGGCLSKKRCSKMSTKKPDLTTVHGFPGCEADPPPLPEEETVVKEVLSETPKPSAVTKSFSKSGGEDVKIGKEEVLPRPGGGGDRSEESSEIYSVSVSESFSVSTTVTEKRGGGEEEVGETEVSSSTAAVTKWRGERSPASKYYQRKRSLTGEFSVGRDNRSLSSSGGGRSLPSPVKRSFPGREPGQATRACTLAGYGNTAVRKDHGERSGRRSVSPASKRTADRRLGSGGVSRSSSMRKTGSASLRRVISSAAKEEEEAREGEVALSPPGKESLENPLVSLECFIFL